MDRIKAYQFLHTLEGRCASPEEAAYLFKDLICHYFLFPNDSGHGSAEKKDLVQEVGNLMNQGQKIHAIKLAREATGWGLKEAKDWVEAGYPPNQLPSQLNGNYTHGNKAGSAWAANILKKIAQDYDVPYEE